MCELYNKIQGLCIEKHITITQMCKESGANRASLTDLKMGRKQSLSAETLGKIADYFDVSVDYLLGKTDVKKAPSSADRDKVTFDDFTYAMYKEAHELTAEEKDKLLELARFFNENRKKGK